MPTVSEILGEDKDQAQLPHAMEREFFEKHLAMEIELMTWHVGGIPSTPTERSDAPTTQFGQEFFGSFTTLQGVLDQGTGRDPKGKGKAGKGKAGSLAGSLPPFFPLSFKGWQARSGRPRRRRGRSRGQFRRFFFRLARL